MKVYAIVAAGGTGSRFKSNHTSLPKQFSRLKNKPVILYSMLALQRCKAVCSIIVSVDKKYFGLLRTLAEKNKITRLEFAQGGRTRFDSVKNAFRKIKGSKNDLVLIHDAARPLIDRSDVSKIISEAKKHGAVIYALKVSDTVKKSAGNYVSRTVNRDNLWLTQTPQVFRYGILAKAYSGNKKKSYTDESSLVEAAGFDVGIIQGKKRNVKITTAEDFEMVRKLI